MFRFCSYFISRTYSGATNPLQPSFTDSVSSDQSPPHSLMSAHRRLSKKSSAPPLLPPLPPPRIWIPRGEQKNKRRFVYPSIIAAAAVLVFLRSVPIELGAAAMSVTQSASVPYESDRTHIVARSPRERERELLRRLPYCRA